MIVEPRLLTMEGQMEHRVLEKAIDTVVAGHWPGWIVRYDEIVVELVTGGRSKTWIESLASLGDTLPIFTQSDGQTPERVWVVILEHLPTQRRELLKFLLAGGSDDSPIWVRIDPESSKPTRAN